MRSSDMSLETLAPRSHASLRAVWDAQAHHADQWAGLYDSVYDAWQPCYRSYRERVAEVVYSCWYEGRGRVLDAGCGTGSILQLLGTRIPRHLLAGVDVSPKMIQHCSDRLKGVELCTTPFEEYVASEPFDVVFFANSFRHMPDHRLVAQQLAGVARPGARVVVFETNPQWLYTDPWLSRRARLLSPRWLLWRFRGGLQMQRTRATLATLPTSPGPDAAVSPDGISEAFAPLLRLRSHRSSFGVTRLYEEVLTDNKVAEDPTRPVTHQNRPWSKTLTHLQKADRDFAAKHPHSGGMMELVFDRDHRG